MSGATASAALATPPDPDALYAGFMARAEALAASPAKVAGADALVCDVLASGLSDATHRPLAAAMGKATGLDGSAFLKQMQGARAAAGKAGQAAGARPVTGMQNPDPAPAPDPLDAVLDQVARAVQRQVVCAPADATAAALWVAGTYGFRGATIFPRLAITSTTKRCGKSTLLGLLGATVSTPVKADNVTASAVFRLIEGRGPTLLIDEVDAFFSKSDDLRGVVNAGYERTGAVLRSVPTPDGKGFTEAEYNVYCPKALAGIGGLPDTVLDRSLIVRLHRAPKRGAGGQRKSPLRYRDLEKLRTLLAPHLVAHGAALEAAMAAGCAALPRELSDRAQDNWEPLLAIADLAGGAWPGRARAAALALSGGDDAPSHREMMLADLRGIVDGERAAAVQAWQGWRAAGRKGARPAPARRIRSSTAAAELLRMEHRPWPEYGKDGKGITPARLATMLRPFGIQPSDQRMPILSPHKLATTATEVVRTYPVPALRAAFRQYL